MIVEPDSVILKEISYSTTENSLIFNGSSDFNDSEIEKLLQIKITLVNIRGNQETYIQPVYLIKETEAEEGDADVNEDVEL